jgi:hypothetical protein
MPVRRNCLRGEEDAKSGSLSRPLRDGGKTIDLADHVFAAIAALEGRGDA